MIVRPGVGGGGRGPAQCVGEKFVMLFFCMLAKHIIRHFLGFFEGSKTFLMSLYNVVFDILYQTIQR